MTKFGYIFANVSTFWCTFYRPILCGGVSKLTNMGYGQVSDQSNLENDDSFIIHIIICVSQHETNWSHLVMLVDVENLMI